ncbi:MAG: type VI secretion system contractile sheath small subunit [Alphaproteobacteria bacterium]
MATESIQHKLDRVRKPRVQITYDVEIGNAIEMKELPFIVGILADLSGMPAEPLPKMKERKFVEIDRDNINEVMSSITPRLALHVDNRLANDGTFLNVELNFRNMEDFAPVNVVKQVPVLARLYEARVRLKDLLTKLDGNDVLDGLLQQIISNTEQQAALQKELGIEAPAKA